MRREMHQGERQLPATMKERRENENWKKESRREGENAQLEILDELFSLSLIVLSLSNSRRNLHVRTRDKFLVPKNILLNRMTDVSVDLKHEVRRVSPSNWRTDELQTVRGRAPSFEPLLLKQSEKRKIPFE